MLLIIAYDYDWQKQNRINTIYQFSVCVISPDSSPLIGPIYHKIQIAIVSPLTPSHCGCLVTRAEAGSGLGQSEVRIYESGDQ